jgi:ATP-binding cassette, subfamily B, bacterial
MQNPKNYLIKRVLLQSRPFWFHIAGYFLLTLLATPIALMKPFALKFLIDCGFGSARVPEFFKFFLPNGLDFSFTTIALVAAFLAIAIALLDNIQVYLVWIVSTVTGEKLVLNFRTLVFNHAQRLSLAYHDTKGASDSLYRIQWDTMCIRSLLLNQLPPLISSFITLLSMVFVMFAINWQFALITLCIMPPLIILSHLSRKKLKKHYYTVKNNESVALSVIHEVLSSLRVVKAFGQEENENDRFMDRSNIAVKSQIKLTRTAAGFSFIVGMFLAIGTAFFLYVGANFVHAGQMTLGELTLVIAYLSQVFTPLQSIIKNLNEVQSSLASINRVFSVLDEEKEVRELPHAKSLKRAEGNFVFQNVSFRYQKEKATLSNVSFTIRAGDRVGIMGSTGAGKSTLISLLMRLYDPTDGNITVDGTDVKNYKLVDYRKQFSVVLQEPVLFSTTIKENIRYGRPDATEKEIIDAAIAANAHNFILKTKDGYDTMVGERGMQLSGGERQRISIARAFIKNAPVLVLDEPTSSLDIKTEGLIMEAMERLMEGRTTFMISHRLDTLNTCNVILHLEEGGLVDVVRDHHLNFISNKKAAFLNHA